MPRQARRARCVQQKQRKQARPHLFLPRLRLGGGQLGAPVPCALTQPTLQRQPPLQRPPCLPLYLYASNHRSPRPGEGVAPRHPPDLTMHLSATFGIHTGNTHHARAIRHPTPAPPTIPSTSTPNATSPGDLSRPRPNTRQDMAPLPIPVLGLALGPLTPQLIPHTLLVAKHCMPTRRTGPSGRGASGKELSPSPRAPSREGEGTMFRRSARRQARAAARSWGGKPGCESTCCALQCPAMLV